MRTVWMLAAALLLVEVVRADEAQPVPADGVIAQPGTYRLDADLLTDRHPAIRVVADDVTLDLGGHAIRYTGEPQPGVFGIVVRGRRNVRITNGSIGGFWFNVQSSDTTGLRIDDVRFDDIVYIAINAARATGLLVNDCTFTNFRYDVPRDDKSHYVVAINTGAANSLITRNRFIAEYTLGDPAEAAIETVFVLFSAKVSLGSVVADNEMTANAVIHRSYGVWAATQTDVTLARNTIRNMHHGVTLASQASAILADNQIVIDGSTPLITDGIAATGARRVLLANNVVHGQTQPILLPNEAPFIDDGWYETTEPTADATAP